MERIFSIYGTHSQNFPLLFSQSAILFEMIKTHIFCVLYITVPIKAAYLQIFIYYAHHQNICIIKYIDHTYTFQRMMIEKFIHLHFYYVYLHSMCFHAFRVGWVCVGGCFRLTSNKYYKYYAFSEYIATLLRTFFFVLLYIKPIVDFK